jgi:hypothetical protein
MAEAFAKQTKGGANIIVIGRNKRMPFQAFLLPHQNQSPVASLSKYDFIACDASVMKNVHNTTQELLRRLDKNQYPPHQCRRDDDQPVDTG